MINLDPKRRRIAAVALNIGAIGSAAMFVVTLAGISTGTGVSVRAAENAGAAVVLSGSESDNPGQPLDAGGSATPFSLGLPVGAACTGDSAVGDYRIQSYFVPASVDPATLTYAGSGPTPTGVGANLRQSLRMTTSTRYVNQTTAIADTPNGPGLVLSIPDFNFSTFGATGPQDVPAGTYNIGIACTKGSASPTQLDRYWNVQITFAADASDVPSGITWELAEPDTSTTTTTTTSTTTSTTLAPTGSSTTTTVAGSATSTTLAGAATSTTVAGATSTAVPGATSTTLASTFISSQTGGPSGTVYAPTSTLAVTGSSPTGVAFWGLLMLAFGRMAMLLARKPKIVPAGES